MAQSSELHQAAEKIGARASAASAEARRAARAATSEAARSVRSNGEVVRNVFHDLADEAEQRARSAGEATTAVGRMVARGTQGQPLLTVALIAGAAALVGFALTRR